MTDSIPEKRMLDRPLFWHGLAFVTGIGLGLVLPLSFFWYLSLLLLAVLAGIIALVKKFPALLLLLPLVIGLYWAGSGVREPQPFPYQEGQTLEINGMALNNADVSEEGIASFYFRPDTVDGSPYRGGNLIIYSDRGENIAYGDRLMVKGEVLPVRTYGNLNAFDYQEYLLQNNIVAVVSAAYGGEIIRLSEQGGNPFLRFAARTGTHLEQAFDALPGNQGVLLKGVFLGDKSGLETEEKNILIETGIIHAFAVSGLHVGYIILFVLLIIGPSRRRRWLRLALGGFLLFFYLALVGFSPSVVRATIMALIGLWAFFLDEKADPYVSLAVAAVLILLYRPALLYNAGFQLSFAAAFGIFYLGPFFDGILPEKPFWGRQALIAALSATWAVTPLSAYYFHIASLIGWLISPLVLLVIGGVIAVCLVAALFAVFSPFMAALPLYAGGLLLEAVYRLCAFLSGLSFSWLTVGTPGITVIIVYYLILLSLPVLIKKIPHLPLPGLIKKTPRIYLGLLTLMMALLIVLPVDRDRAGDLATLGGASVMEVDFLDVGQGDAALVIAPGGETVLIDGGGNGNDDEDYWIGENVLLPYLRSQGVDHIDFIISSHPHADHLSGLITVLRELPVKYFLTVKNFNGDTNQERALALCKERGVKIVYLDQGDKYPLTEEIVMEVFSPKESDVINEDFNAASLVVKLSYQEIDFLFTGDVEGDNLLELCDEDIDAEVLKIPHHGSINSYNEEFYQKSIPRPL